MQRHGIGRQLQRPSSGSTPHDRVTTPQICSSRSPALDRPRQSTLRYPAGISNRPTVHHVRRDPPPIHQPLHRRTTPLDRLDLNHTPHPRLSNTHSACCTALRSLSAVSLYGAFFVKEFAERQIFCLSSVSLFDLKARFFVPARGSLTSSRAGAVKVCRRANLAACSELARPYLDSFEHDGTLSAIGMTIRGEPAFGRGSVAPQPCIRWVQGPEP